MTQRMSAAEYQVSILNAPKPTKFGAKKVEYDGYKFDSKREHARYCDLKVLLKSGDIADLKVHPKFEIVVNGQKICSYTADFSYFEILTPFNGGLCSEYIVEDVKSPPTRKKRDYRLTKKLMKAVHGIEIREVL